jgi:hypothetical protein
MNRIIRFLENTIKKTFIFWILRNENETKCKLQPVISGKGLHIKFPGYFLMPRRLLLLWKNPMNGITLRIHIHHQRIKHFIPGYLTARLFQSEDLTTRQHPFAPQEKEIRPDRGPNYRAC